MRIELTPFPPEHLHQENVLCDGRRVGYRCTRTNTLSWLVQRAHKLNTREMRTVEEFIRLVGLPDDEFMAAARPSVGFGAGVQVEPSTASDLLVAAAAWDDGKYYAEASACRHRAGEIERCQSAT